MEAIIEEMPRMLILSGYIGNAGNSEAPPNQAVVIGDLKAFPNGIDDAGYNWEQTDAEVVFPVTEDIPVIPDRYKTLDIGAETVPVSDQWAYRDAQGKILFYVQRFNATTGRKEFRPLMLFNTESGLKWKRKAPAEPRPLYGLDRLAARPDAEVIVCEGEKATEAATRLFPDKVAVSSMNGAKSPDKSDWSSLTGRTVSLWGDFDEPGASYITAVEQLATEAGATVIHAVRPEWFLQMGVELGIMREALPAGWDAADAEQEGFTVDNIQTFIALEKNPQDENSLFGRTPSQQVLLDKEIAQSNDNNRNDDAVVVKKHTQIRELFMDSEFAVIEYRKGFKNGVYWQEPFGDDDVPKHPTLLCSPLIVVAETRDTDQSNWGRLLSWLDNDGHSHNWACPVEMLAATDTAEFRRELVRNGLMIVTNGKARQKLVD